MKNLSCELVFFILLTFGTLRAIGFCLVPFGRKQDWKEDHECNESKKGILLLLYKQMSGSKGRYTTENR